MSSADVKQKSKKHKKHKSDHNDVTASSLNDIIQSDIVPATCDGLPTSETKKKKKKRQADVANMELSGDGGSVVVAEEDGTHKDEKSAKKCKRGTDVQSTSETSDIRNTTTDDSSCKRIKTADGKYRSLRFCLSYCTCVTRECLSELNGMCALLYVVTHDAVFVSCLCLVYRV